MEQSIISRKHLIFSIALSIVILSVIFIKTTFGNSTKIVFCDVGQGDATYIRVRNKIDILVDAGPGNSVLNCISKHMPFFDRKIEFAVLSHPQKDHYGGFVNIVGRYKIERFLTVDDKKVNNSYDNLLKKLKEKRTSILFPTSNTKIKILDGEIEFLWPDKQFINNNESQVLGISKSDENNYSLIFQFKEKNSKILFTGDATAELLNNLVQNIKINHKLSQIKTTVLKIPHHGSKNSLSLDFLKLADPVFSVISVGKNNIYGHPAKEVIDVLRALNKKYARTDTKGDIIINLP